MLDELGAGEDRETLAHVLLAPLGAELHTHPAPRARIDGARACAPRCAELTARLGPPR